MIAKCISYLRLVCDSLRERTGVNCSDQVKEVEHEKLTTIERQVLPGQCPILALLMFRLEEGTMPISAGEYASCFSSGPCRFDQRCAMEENVLNLF